MQMKCFENLDKWQWTSSMYPEADVEMIESSAHVYKQASDKYTKIRYLWLAQCRCSLVFSNFDINVHQHSQCSVSNQTAWTDIQALDREPVLKGPFIVFIDFERLKH